MNWLNQEQKNSLKEIPLYKNLDNIQIYEGWFDVIKEMGLTITQFCLDNKIELPIVNNIKTKFGTLRFNYNDVSKDNILNDKLNKLIIDWTYKVNNTCEVCGSNKNVVNVINDNFIVISLCKNHRLDSYKKFDLFTNFSDL